MDENKYQHGAARKARPWSCRNVVWTLISFKERAHYPTALKLRRMARAKCILAFTWLPWTTHFILLSLSVSAVSLLEPSYSWKPMRLFHSFRNSFGAAQERTKEARAEENTETGMFLSPCLIAKRGLKSLRMGRISTLSLSTLRSRLLQRA